MNKSVCSPLSPDFSGSDSSLPYSWALPGRHFPTFNGTMKELRLLDAHLVRSLFTRGAIPPLTLSIRSHPRQDRRVCAWMLLSRSHPVSGNFGGDAKLSHVRREPLRLCPAPSIPAKPPRQVIAALRFCPRCSEHEGLDIQPFSRDSFARLQHSLSTLRAALSDDDARLVSVWRPPFHRRAFHPSGSDKTFQL